MARKINVEFVVQGRVEATVGLATLPVIDSKSKRGRKKKLALDPEDYDMGEEVDRKRATSDDNESMSLLKKNLNEVNSESESGSKRNTRGGKQRGKKKGQEEEEETDFPAPKSKPSRAPRGSAAKKGGGRSGKKTKDLSPQEDADSIMSSNKNAEDSPSNLDNDLDIDDMKLEDDEEDQLDEDLEDDDNFHGLNALSTKNVLKLARMQQEELGANSDKNSVTDISSLNIDVNKLTRRQKTQLKNQANLNIDVEEPLMQLPDKKPRKKKEKDLTEEQQIKKMETANKRKMLNQKLQEEQKKQTINKILNEAGRKQKQRKEKEDKDQKGKENHQFRTLPEGEVGIKFVSKANESFLVLPEDYNIQNLLIDPTY